VINGVRRPFGTLAKAEEGSTLLEFAFIAPTLCMLLMGAMDVGHTLYMNSMVEGIVQKTARDASLEGGQLAANQTAMDTRIRTEVSKLVNNATTTITRTSFMNFRQASRRHEPFTDMPSAGPDGIYTVSEAFTDVNGNGVYDVGEPFVDTMSAPDGVCNNGEVYVDEDNSTSWTANLGRTGQGGAKDAVVYRVEVNYPAVFPLYSFLGMSNQKQITATTVLRNQPYGDQAGSVGTTTRNCT
jgi:Flp pilus assembly protein TadG